MRQGVTEGSADWKVTVNFAAILRGDPEALQSVALAMSRAVEQSDGRARLIFKTVSGSPLRVSEDRGGARAGD
jgi:hypothetical protein